MKTFYFTFPASSPLHKGFVKVEATTPKDAVAKMLGLYGKPIWSLIYPEGNDIDSLIVRKSLYEIPFGYMPEER